MELREDFLISSFTDWSLGMTEIANNHVHRLDKFIAWWRTWALDHERLPIGFHVPRSVQNALRRIPRSGYMPRNLDYPELDLDPRQHGPQPDFDDMEWYANWHAQSMDPNSEAFRLFAQKFAKNYDWARMSRLEAESMQVLMKDRSDDFQRVMDKIFSIVEQTPTGKRIELVFKDHIRGNIFAMLILESAIRDPNTEWHEPWPFNTHKPMYPRERKPLFRPKATKTPADASPQATPSS